MATPDAFYSLSRTYGSYTGSIVTLREDNGSTTQEFKFDGSNNLVTNDVSEDTVAAWLTANSASNAYCTQWWDQSGNANHATQSTTTKQPLYVEDALNGHPGLKGDGTDDHLEIPDGILSYPGVTALAAIRTGTEGSFAMAVTANGGALDFRMGRGNSSDWHYAAGSTRLFGGTHMARDEQKRVLSYRHNGTGNTLEGRVDSLATNDTTRSITGAITSMAMLCRRDGFFPANGHIAEVILYDSALSDTDLETDESELITQYAIAPSVNVTLTDIDAAITGADATDCADITGNGLQDILLARQDGHVYWYEQTSAGSFTQRTILGSAVTGAAVEGCLLIDIDNDGEYEAVVADQANNAIRVYKQDTPGTPTGTWTGGTIQSSRTELQDLRAWDIDDDGIPEIVYTFEGSGTGNGGIHWLKYAGSGDVTSSANYTDYAMCQHTGAWGLCHERKDLAGNGRGDIVFTGRDQVAAHVSGIYWIEEPSDPTTTWTVHTIDNDDQDWLHVDFGDWHGNGHGKDVVAIEFDGMIKVYDFSNAWAATTVITAANNDTSGYNVRAGWWATNGKDAIIQLGNPRITVWQWDNEDWDWIGQQGMNKVDENTTFVDLFSDNVPELIFSDSNVNKLQYATFVDAPEQPQPSFIAAWAAFSTVVAGVLP